MHPEMQGVTLDVILRTVFGLDEGPPKRELRAALLDLLDIGSNPQLLLAAQQANGQRAGRGRALPRGPRRASTGLLFAEIAPAGRPT